MTTTPACPECGATIARIHAEINPRTIDYDMLTQCGHVLDSALAKDLWSRGYRWTVPVVDGTSLMTAERTRQVVEEGYSPEHDAEHGSADLPWAAWSYLDRAVHPTDSPVPPTAWPWDEAAWNATAEPIRRLVIAGALIAAEIDRRLAAERTKT